MLLYGTFAKWKHSLKISSHDKKDTTLLILRGRNDNATAAQMYW